LATPIIVVIASKLPSPNGSERFADRSVLPRPPLVGHPVAIARVRDLCPHALGVGGSMTMNRFFMIPAAALVAMGTAIALIAPWDVSAQVEAASRNCGLHTLHGEYGLVGSGIRGLGPGTSESFATISMVDYDGQGGFTAMGVSHGQVTGVRAGLPVTGTYHVDPDCTGGQTTNIPGVPPLEDSFVIVDNGREVRTVVTSPATTIATANLRKK
jgi:hypothetical protein